MENILKRNNLVVKNVTDYEDESYDYQLSDCLEYKVTGYVNTKDIFYINNKIGNISNYSTLNNCLDYTYINCSRRISTLIYNGYLYLISYSSFNINDSEFILFSKIFGNSFLHEIISKNFSDFFKIENEDLIFNPKNLAYSLVTVITKVSYFPRDLRIRVL